MSLALVLPNAISQEFFIGFSQIPRNPLGFIAAWRCHYEIIEATLWSLNSTAAHRELSEGYFIPEHGKEIDQVAVSSLCQILLHYLIHTFPSAHRSGLVQRLGWRRPHLGTSFYLQLGGPITRKICPCPSLLCANISYISGSIAD